MTNNQTIDGVLVSRELLERFVSSVEAHRYGFDGLEELRALLDAPDMPADNKCGVQMVDCPECTHQWDHFFDCGNTPAAQPRGEPVAYRCRHSESEPWFFSDKPGYWEWQALFVQQPAPLKIGHGVAVRNIGFGCDEERKPYLIFADNGNLNEVNLVDVSMISRLRSYTVPELEELGVQVEQPAPLAVVLPERMEPRDPYDSEARDWNACIDEVTRLNTVKP